MPAESSRAVFLSYASQDAAAARRICETLRAEGVEVWFDADGGLEHGDEWDQKIRRQIKECVLFIPLISANTQAREEGYFRLEWDLAAERARTIASGVPFILPVVIDDTREPDALVPDRFRMVQWTKLPGGVVTPEVRARYLKLWSHRTGVLKHESDVARVYRPVSADDTGQETRATASRRVPTAAWIGAGVAFAALVAFIALHPKSNSGAANIPPTAEAAAPVSEARKLVARARLLLDRPEMARIELNTADGFCKRAAELDDSDAEVWATWSQVNTWFVYYNFDGSLARREAARDHAARALRLAPRSFEARLAQACYWMRGEGLDVGFTSEEKPPLYLAEAERMLRELHAEQPEEPRTLLMLGFLRVWKDKDLPERYDLLERVTKNPAFAAEAWKEIGWIKLFQGDPAGAVSAADRSIAIQPTWNNLWLRVVLATVWLGDRDLAKSTVERMPVAALQEDVGLLMTYWVYGWRHEPLLALGPLERQPRDWLRMSGYLGPKALLAGKLRRMANQPELARRDFLRARELVEQALATDQNNRNLLSLRAQALHFLGEDDEARRTFRIAYELGARGPELETLFVSPDTLFDGTNAYIDSLQGRPNLLWNFSAAALRYNPDYSVLRKHPRFPALLARLDADPRFSPTAKSIPSATTKPDDKSVAVLAFANLSDDKANEYFSDGISEELLNVLAKVPGVKVSARTSAFSFKGKNTPVPEIARQLGVAYVVEGSVRKAGDKVRITAQLIKAVDGFPVWSETFPRDLKDIFAVQDEIAGLIARSLSAQLGVTAAAPRREIAPAAYEEFLAGRALAAAGTAEATREALARFRRVAEGEPGFTAAWVQIARGYVHLNRWGGLRDETEWAEARRAMERALALEPASPDVQLALGWVRRTLDWNWKGAEQALREAQRLRPDHAETLAALGVLLANLGREQEAIAAAQRAAALDPLNAAVQMDLLVIFYCYGRHPEAAQAGRRAVELAPGNPLARSWLARSLTELGRLDEAEAELARITDWAARLGALSILRAKQGRMAEARQLAGEMEAKAAEASGAENSYGYLANVWGILGDAKRGMDYAEKTRATRDPSVAWVRTGFFARHLAGDPRWPAFLRSIGLADEQLK